MGRLWLGRKRCLGVPSSGAACVGCSGSPSKTRRCFPLFPAFTGWWPCRSMARQSASWGQGGATLGKEQRKDKRSSPSKLLSQPAEAQAAGFSAWPWGAAWFPMGARRWRWCAEGSDLAVVLTVALGSPGNIFGVSVSSKQMGTGPEFCPEAERVHFA